MGAPPICGRFSSSRLTASANTVFRKLVAPFCGPSGGPRKKFTVSPESYAGGTGKPNWHTNADAFTHVTDLWYTSLTTAHSLYVMRPLNWTYTVAAVSSNTTAVTLAYDPGTWATAGIYKYGIPEGGTVPNFANNVMAASDVLAYQLNDGTWQIDTVSSISSLALVLGTGTPNVTGAGIAAYSPIFWFGAVGDTDPATGAIHPLIDSVAATALRLQAQGTYGSLWSGLHRGDPLVFVSSNGTDAGILEHLGGFYCKDW